MSRGETTGNDNVCEVISPWQGPPHPQGGLGATRLQPQCSALPLSLMPLPSHLIDRCVDNTCLQYLNKVYCIQATVFVEITYDFTNRSKITHMKIHLRKCEKVVIKKKFLCQKNDSEMSKNILKTCQVGNWKVLPISSSIRYMTNMCVKVYCMLYYLIRYVQQ